jgi:crotonobetainyl-CoA:carnitine CoA-transferase CaiB-like acyl-CoA transferase
MALFHRERTGQGQEIHVPMMDTMLAFLLVEHLWGASICEPERGLGYPRMLTPHRRPYATKDGHICVIAVTDDQWSRLFAVIGHADLMLDPRFATPRARANHIDTLYAVLTEAMRSRSTADWLAGLNQADLPCGPVNSLEDLMHNDYLAQTGFFQPVEHPTEGCTTLLRNPVSFSATPNSVHRLPPKLGADTAAVLKELEQSRST